MTIDGLNLALTTQVTQSNGRKDFKNAVLVYWRALLLTLGIFAIIALILSQNMTFLIALHIKENVAEVTNEYV